MENATIKMMKSRLLAMKETLQKETARGTLGTETVALDQQSVGRLSRMDALQNQAMAKASQARRGQMIRRIDAALVRISQGEYGYCIACGDDIAAKRLEFDPSIATCISCAANAG